MASTRGVRCLPSVVNPSSDCTCEDHRPFVIACWIVSSSFFLISSEVEENPSDVIYVCSTRCTTSHVPRHKMLGKLEFGVSFMLAIPRSIIVTYQAYSPSESLIFSLSRKRAIPIDLSRFGGRGVTAATLETNPSR
jgi:hypothetical protein